MANPYYIQQANILPGLEKATSSLVGLAKAKQEKTKKDELASLFETGTPEEVASFLIKNPELAQNFDNAKAVKLGITKERAVDEAYQILKGEVDPHRVMLGHSEEALAAGVDASAPMALAKDALAGGDKSKKAAMVTLAHYDPKGLKAYMDATATAVPEAVKLTANQKDYRLAKREGFGGTFMEYQNALKAKPAEASTSTADQKNFEYAVANGFTGTFMEYQNASGSSGMDDTRRQLLQVQILDLQDRMQGREDKKQEVATMADKKMKGLVAGIDSVLEEVDRATTMAKTSPTATGVTGAATGPVPGTPSYKLRKVLGTVQANLGFDKLQDMRNNSPTGGALGQVSERELAFLQATITALDPNMGEEELLKSLEKIKRHYNNWRETALGRNPYETVIGQTEALGSVTEADIQTTMRVNSLSREDVLAKLGLK